MTPSERLDGIEVWMRVQHGDGARGRRSSLLAVPEPVDHGDPAGAPRPVDGVGIARHDLGGVRTAGYANGDRGASHFLTTILVPAGCDLSSKSSINRRADGSPEPSPPPVV